MLALASASMSTLRLPAGDLRMSMSDYFDFRTTNGESAFDRCYDPNWGCNWPGSFADEPRMTPGVTISVQTDAPVVRAALHYGGRSGYCSADCPGTPPSFCYHPPNGLVCRNRCEPKVYVDGRLARLAGNGGKSQYGGDQTFVLLDAGSDRRTRTIELVLPWGAVVSFRHLELDGWREEPRAPHGAAWGVAPRKGGRVVFYGDSITQGFCADEPYPEVLARMNNWEAINLGIGGMKTIGRHGKALGQLKADIVMLAIGTNDWWDCHDIEGAIGQLIDGVRQTQRTVPIVAVTPLVAHYEGTAKCGGGNGLEALRDQIRTAVTKRSGRDSKLYVVEGKALLPLTWMGDRLHPTSDGMRELAKNINAEMGYGALRWRLPNRCVAAGACEESTLTHCAP